MLDRSLLTVSAIPTIQKKKRAPTTLDRCTLWSMEPEPQPCKRFWRMRVTPAFWAHLKNCPKCTAVIRYLERQFEIDRFLWQHRN
jgi:hypothetical protein